MKLFATSVSPDYKAEGLGWFSSLSYDTIFDSNYTYFTLDILEASFFPSSSVFTGHFGLLTQFSFDIDIFDLYLNLGFTLYPFKKILSVSGNFGLGLSFYSLNHFSYITDIKANIDIPIFKGGHNVTFGAGLRHRNALKIIGYLNLDSEYYNIYNSYFFEMGYRFIIK
jgi:hypothetical protein